MDAYVGSHQKWAIVILSGQAPHSIWSFLTLSGHMCVVRGRDVMRAIVQDVYGSADRLRLSEIEKPVIAANEVLVQVRAAGVDRGTCHLMRGEPYLMRILGFGFRGPKNRVPGLDVAGTVARGRCRRHQVPGR